MASSNEAPPPHIIAIPFPLPGHILPLLQLSKILVTYGFSVTFVYTQRYHSKVLQILSADEETAAQPQQQEYGVGIRLVSIPDGLPASLVWWSWEGFRARHLAWENLRWVFEPVVEKLASVGTPLVCILSDAHLGWAQDVADKYGIPRVAFWVSSAAECQIYCHARRLISEGTLPFKGNLISLSFSLLHFEGALAHRFPVFLVRMALSTLFTVPMDRCIQDEPDNLIPGICGKRPLYHRVSPHDPADEGTHIPGLPLLDRANFPSFLQIQDSCDVLFQYYVNQIKRLSEAHIVLFNSFLELEASVLTSMRAESINAHALGPLFLLKEKVIPSVKHDLPTMEDRCLSWLGKQSTNSVMYVAFGSTIPLPPAQITALANGLEASQQTFLWALHLDTDLEQCDAFPEGFLDRTKGRGLIVDWAPQTFVLRHPSVGGFMSHCGWNSVVESMSLGVPVIGFPVCADHALICKLLEEEWRVGLRLKDEGEEGIMSSEDVERLARELMEGKRGEELRKRAGEWSGAANRAVESGGSSWASLEMVVEILKQKSSPGGGEAHGSSS